MAVVKKTIVKQQRKKRKIEKRGDDERGREENEKVKKEDEDEQKPFEVAVELPHGRVLTFSKTTRENRVEPAELGKADATREAIYTLGRMEKDRTTGNATSTFDICHARVTLLIVEHFNWQLPFSKKAADEYIWFLKLKAEKDDYSRNVYHPSPLIDQIWHTHILLTKKYIEDCEAMFGEEKFFHHELNRFDGGREFTLNQVNRQGRDMSFWLEDALSKIISEDDSLWIHRL